MAKRVKVIDKGYKAAVAALNDLHGRQVTVGLHASAGGHSEPEGPGMTNVKLGAIHEFGARINHPGGTPYKVASFGGSSRSGGIVGGGQVTWLRKGSPDAIGLTRAHIIIIPQRSFIRSAFDQNVEKYQRAIQREARKVALLKQSPYRAIDRIGEIAKADIIRGINRGISPPLKPATIRRKRSSKPLIDTGQLKQAIRYESSKVER
jgi:hypothetical protein